MVSLTLAPGEPDELVLDESELIDVEVARTHTGVSTWQATVPRDPSLPDRFFDEILIKRSDGTVLFRGFLLSADASERDATSRLSGEGVAYQLRNDETVVTYQNILAHEAVRDFWQNQTGFSVILTDPTPRTTVDDKPVQTASTTSEFSSLLSIGATDPIEITNDRVQLLQSGFFFEAEDAFSLSGQSSDTDASEGETETLLGGSADSDTASFTTSYEIPASNVGVGLRIKDLDSDNDGGTEGTAFDVEINGETVLSANSRIIPQPPSFTWVTGSGIGSNLSSGTHSVSITGTGNTTDGNASTLIDAVFVYDNRYNYTFDNTVDTDNHLSGPQLYPDAFEITFPSTTTNFNITRGKVDSTWSDVSNQQRLQVQFDANWLPDNGNEDNTQVVDVSSPVTTRSLRGRARLSRHGSRTTATPTSGFLSQELQGWSLEIDGNDLVLFEDRQFEGSLFQIGQAIHEEADLRFVVEHKQNSKPVRAFQVGDVTESLPSAVTDVEQRVDSSRRRSVEQYHNHVTVRGATVSGTRLTATESDTQEINNLGKQHLDVLDPSLDTQTAVTERAKSLLDQSLRERVLKGEVVTTPSDVLPGVSYSNPFNSTADTVPVEEHRLRLARDRIESELLFDFRAEALAEDIGGLRRGQNNVGRGL
jgi:hypothetical protein